MPTHIVSFLGDHRLPSIYDEHQALNEGAAHSPDRISMLKRRIS